MKKLALRASALLCIIAMYSAQVEATDLHEPMRARILEEPRAAEAGVPYEATLQFTVSDPAVISSIRLTGVGWQASLSNQLRGLVVEEGGSFEVAFTATPTDPDRPLELELVINGERWSRSIDLSARAFEETIPQVMVATATEAHPVTPGGVTPTLEERVAFARAPEPDDSAKLLSVESDANVRARAGILHLTGQVGYTHATTGEFVPARNPMVQIFYDMWDGYFDPTYTGMPFSAGYVIADAQGNFDVGIDWPPGKIHNKVWVMAVASNSDAVLQHTDFSESTWRFSSPVYEDVTVGAIQFGQLTPAKESRQAAFHIMNTISRGREYMASMGYPSYSVEVQWPESGDTSWHDYWHDLHITASSEFKESVILHEWGHRWMSLYAWTLAHDYDNDMCDDGDPGHCIWCPEDTIIAWKEGFSNFLSQMMTDYIKINYSVPSVVDAYQFESLKADGNCLGNLNNQQTEGFFAATLYDMVDGTIGEDDPFFPGYTDQVEGLFPEILTAATTPFYLGVGDGPNRSHEFYSQFLYQNLGFKNDIWETMMNNGWDIDAEDPGVVSNLSLSSSHTIGVSSPDNTVPILWDAPTDDASGIAGYAAALTLNSVMTPGFVQNLGPETMMISNPLVEGSYYFSIRALDRAGNWSSGYATLGPIVIRTAEPANLAAYQRPGWEYPLVPRNAPASNVDNVTVTSTLTGGTGSTYWNAVGINDGEQITSTFSRVGLTRDGSQIMESIYPGLGPGVSATVTNMGPFLVAGGRHTMGMFLDHQEIIAESDENDNHWARQWVWRPLSLADDVITVFAAPPERSGGFEHIKSGSVSYWNNSGHKVPWSIPVTAVWTYGSGAQTDYDLALYGPAATPDSGFDVVQAASSRGVGCVDAVLIHGVNDGLSDHNAAVTNLSSSTDNYRIEKVVSSYVSPGDSDLIWMTNNDMFSARTLTVPAGVAGNITLEIISNPGSQPLYMAYFGTSFTTAGLTNAQQTVMVADGSSASIQVYCPSGELGGLAIYRDPKDGELSLNFSLRCSVTLPDLAASTPANWYGAFVPQVERTITYPFDTVPTPTILHGDANTTYFYMAEFNESPAPANGASYHLRIDGQSQLTFERPALAGALERHFVNASALTVPSGRHTVSVALDADDNLVEESEANNGYGQQWVWDGPAVGVGGTHTFAAPSLRTAGFDEITQGLAFYNGYGFDIPSFGPATGIWGGVYLVSDPTVDLDLRLHDPIASTLNRYTLAKGASSWSGRECDFVLANFQSTAYQGFDASVTNIYGTGDGTVQTVGSTNLGPVYASPFGVFTLPANVGMALHEISLLASWYLVELTPKGDTLARLGLSVYGGTESIFGKSEPTYQAISQNYIMGEKVSVPVKIETPGSYCIAVWKVDQEEFAKAPEYTISINEQATAVGDDVPVPDRTRLVGVVPNPFNPRTTVAFDLADAGRVDLSIYSVRGEHVATLLDEFRPIGRGEITWNGVDEHGQSVASGIYFARLKAGPHESQIKMTLLK